LVGKDKIVLVAGRVLSYKLQNPSNYLRLYQLYFESCSKPGLVVPVLMVPHAWLVEVLDHFDAQSDVVENSLFGRVTGRSISTALAPMIFDILQ